jgi:hypothetical protein
MPKNNGAETRDKGRLAIFDAVQFAIDSIEADTLVGHYVLMNEGKELHKLPKVRLRKGDGALLDGVQIKTRYKLKF